MSDFQPYQLGLGFGQSAPTPSGTEHGQDIEVPLGTPLYAGVDGVAHTGVDNVLGRYVVVTAPNGVKYWFGHLGAFGVKDGQQVTANTFLGPTGGAQNDPHHGDATGPHLWFAAQENGQFVNPLKYLNQNALFAPGSPGAQQIVGSPESSTAASAGQPPVRDVNANLREAAQTLANLLAPHVGTDAASLAETLSTMGLKLHNEYQSAGTPTPMVQDSKFSGVHQAVSNQLGGYQPDESQPPEHLTGLIPPQTDQLYPGSDIAQNPQAPANAQKQTVKQGSESFG